MNLHRIEKDKTALLMIDIQEKLLPAMSEKESLLRNAKIVLELCKAHEIPMLATEQYPQGLGSTVEELSGYVDRKDLYEKMTFSAFTQVRSHLEQVGAKTVIVIGMETHVCVYQTVRDLIREGYEVLIPIDAVSSRTLQNKKVGLDLMKEMGAGLTCTETLLFDLLEHASAPNFKYFSKLIR